MEVVGVVYLDENVIVEEDLSPIPQLWWDDDGELFVSFGTDPDVYAPFLDGYLSHRMQPHKKHITEVVGSLSYTNLIDGFLAHELGHAVDFLRLAEHNGTTVASSLLLEELCEGYKQLPLATASSQAMEFWRTNRGGYRSCLETAGYTEETFMAALHNNTIAYNSIPQELRADMFALDIIKKVYSTTRAK